MPYFPRTSYALVGFLITAWMATSIGQIRVPDKDDDGRIQLPSTKTFRDFQSRLPLDQLETKQHLDEFSQDRALSLTLFGQGRLAYQQEKYEEALASYQRAWLWNPKAKIILSDIVAMAFHLERQELGIRYAILASEHEPRDPMLMEQLGMILAQQGERERGLKMLRAALAKYQAQTTDEEDPREEKSGELAEIHLSLARMCVLNKEYADAAKSFDVLRDVVANPKDYGMTAKSVKALISPPTGFYGLMGESYLQSKQFDNAEFAYGKLHELNKSEPLNVYHSAVLAFEKGDLNAAKSQLKKYFDSESQDAGQAPYELLQEIVEKEKPEDEQKPAFGRAIRKLANRDPANEVLSEYAGALLVEQGDHENAQELLEPLLVGSPTVATYSSLLKTYQKLDLPGKTVALLGQAIDARGDLRLVDDSLEEFAADEEAVKSLLTEANRRRTDKQRPMVGSEAFGVAILCLAAKNFEQADVYYDASVKQTRDKTTQEERQLTWAEESFFADHLSAARKYFSAALDDPNEDTNVASVIELTAMAHELDGATQEALDVLNKALDDDPDSASFLARKGWVYYHAGRSEESAKMYQQVIDRFGEDYSSESIRRAVKDARSIYSNIYVEREDIEAGSELLLRILEEYPEDIGARNDLGYLWADANTHKKRALQMAKEAVAGEPDNAAYLDTLGWAYYRLDENQQALVHLERATGELKADDSVILDHLGDVYDALGKNEDAIKTWRRAAESLKKFVTEEEREMKDKERADLKKIQSKINK